MNLIEKMFGTHSEREVKRILPLVDRIEALRPQMQALSDEQMAEKTKEFKYQEELKELQKIKWKNILEKLNRLHLSVQKVNLMDIHKL